MRTIRRISAAFQLLDSYSKGAVAGASILVDGCRMPFVSKGDGTYVFSELPPTPHTYTISAPGYCTACRQLPAAPPYMPEVVLLQHAPGAPALVRMAYFRLRFLAEGRPLHRQMVRVTLLTPVGGLRLVEGAKAGDYALALAGNYAAGMLFQPCCPQEAPGSELLLTGYDQAAKRYTLQEPLDAPLKRGTLLRPVWDLETDGDGVAILPAVGLFLQREEVEFSFVANQQEQRLVTAPPSPSCNLTVTF